MKGTICYVLCYISTNKILKQTLDSLGWNYFFNTDICYPKNMKELYFDQTEKVEYKKNYDDFNKINRLITLNEVIFVQSLNIYLNIHHIFYINNG